MAIALTLSELAQWIDGDIVRGGLDLSLTGMAALDMAGPHDVSFLGNEKYRAQFLETKAAAVIVPRGVTDGPESAALVAVDNPTLAFSVVVRHFAEISRNFTPGVHPQGIRGSGGRARSGKSPRPRRSGRHGRSRRSATARKSGPTASSARMR